MVEHLASGERRVRLVGEGGELSLLARHGKFPLPPYITREPTPLDEVRYQTVFGRAAGRCGPWARP